MTRVAKPKQLDDAGLATSVGEYAETQRHSLDSRAADDSGKESFTVKQVLPALLGLIAALSLAYVIIIGGHL